MRIVCNLLNDSVAIYEFFKALVFYSSTLKIFNFVRTSKMTLKLFETNRKRWSRVWTMQQNFQIDFVIVLTFAVGHDAKRKPSIHTCDDQAEKWRLLNVRIFFSFKTCFKCSLEIALSAENFYIKTIINTPTNHKSTRHLRIITAT